MASAAAGFNLFPACPLDARQKGAKAGVGRDARCVRVCVCVCVFVFTNAPYVRVCCVWYSVV